MQTVISRYPETELFVIGAIEKFLHFDMVWTAVVVLLRTNMWKLKKQLEDGLNESVIDGYSGFIFKSRYNTVLSPHGVNRVLDRIIKADNDQIEGFVCQVI